ncbi:MAG: UDP-N-acetylmuramoyl-L-alanyl-D-glutamate--2,6-diaminopimelate ligase [Acidimicrobiales bacterium]
MRLSELISGVSVTGTRGDLTGTEVTGIELDSRSVAPGSLFCCIPGAVTDGHRHAPEAVRRGAAALLCERPLDLDIAQVQVATGAVRPAMAQVAAEYYGHPSRSLLTVGVTGTNGKTTVTRLIGDILEQAGVPTGVVGTLGGIRTTPEAPDLQRRLAELVDAGRRAMALEVSSHALTQHRVDGIVFDVAAFTNLSREHLDHHGTMDAYFDAKAQLFAPGHCRVAVVDTDGPWGGRLAKLVTSPPPQIGPGGSPVPALGPRLVTVGRSEATEVRPKIGSTSFRWRSRTVRLPLTGSFNVDNALVAAAVALELGVDEAGVVAGLESARPVPGRMQVVADSPVSVVVDYAHTPEGLESALSALREVAGPSNPAEVGPDRAYRTARLVCVFGCGGDRDRGKRPLMGSVASRCADVVIVTSDNPRSEDPLVIIDEVHHGADGPARLQVEPDRAAAIRLALAEADDGDIVLIAGKGHETTQTVGEDTVPFDDRVVAARALSDRLGTLPR